MPDVAFDSARHAQVSGDMSAGGGELTTSATSALMIATAQIFGHWTTESAAQSMGNTVRSFLTSFSTNMQNETADESGDSEGTPSYGAQSEV